MENRTASGFGFRVGSNRGGSQKERPSLGIKQIPLGGVRVGAWQDCRLLDLGVFRGYIGVIGVLGLYWVIWGEWKINWKLHIGLYIYIYIYGSSCCA